MDTRVLLGLLEVVGLALAPVAMVSVLVRMNLIYEAFMRLGRRLSLFQTPLERPSGPPLEKLAADLRRLRPEARSRTADPSGRRNQSMTAYDAALVATARALDVPTTLAELREGWERDAERFRLEHALTVAGLSWQVQES